MRRSVVKGSFRFAVAGTLALGSILLGNCGGSDEEPPIVVADGDYYHYVNTQLIIPQDSTEALTLGFNLDGDDNDQIDNALGSLISGLSAAAGTGTTIDLNTPVNELIQTGELVLLHSVRANSLTSDASVSWQVFLGLNQPLPDLDGGGMFTVDPAGPTDAKLLGRIVAGTYRGGPATVSIQLALLDAQDPLTIRLVGTRIESEVSATACAGDRGKLGGAILKKDINEEIIPALVPVVNDFIATDCVPTCPTDCSTGVKTALTLLDKDHDCIITVEEVTNNVAVQGLLSPDVDLIIDATGEFKPRTDGILDSISLGLGFKCVDAVFTASNEL